MRIEFHYMYVLFIMYMYMAIKLSIYLSIYLSNIIRLFRYVSESFFLGLMAKNKMSCSDHKTCVSLTILGQI